MTKQEAENYGRLVDRLSDYGFNRFEIAQLVRIERTLQRWGELECGDGNDFASWGIERDEQTNKPYMVTHPRQGKATRRPYPDKEAGALKRLARIMSTKPELVSYHQGDCRGCNLYILRKSDVNGTPVDQCYTRGVAVCY